MSLSDDITAALTKHGVDAVQTQLVVALLTAVSQGSTVFSMGPGGTSVYTFDPTPEATALINFLRNVPKPHVAPMLQMAQIAWAQALVEQRLGASTEEQLEIGRTN